jgi:hypothetical protein
VKDELVVTEKVIPNSELVQIVLKIFTIGAYFGMNLLRRISGRGIKVEIREQRVV